MFSINHLYNSILLRHFEIFGFTHFVNTLNKRFMIKCFIAARIPVRVHSSMYYISRLRLAKRKRSYFSIDTTHCTVTVLVLQANLFLSVPLTSEGAGSSAVSRRSEQRVSLMVCTQFNQGQWQARSKLSLARQPGGVHRLDGGDRVNWSCAVARGCSGQLCV